MRIQTEGKPRNAKPVHKVGMVPAVNRLIFNRERSRTGNFVLRSTRKKKTMRIPLDTTRIRFRASIRLPIVRPTRRRVIELEKLTAPSRSNFSPRVGGEISFSLLCDQYVPKIPIGTLTRKIDRQVKSWISMPLRV